MHNNFSFLQDLLTVFGLGLAAVIVFHRLRLPAVLAFLLTGAICGPYGFKFVEDVASIEGLAEVGVVLLLFTLGIEFSIPHFMRMRRFLLVGGALQVGGTLITTLIIAQLTGAPLALSVFIGMLVSLSSTALVLRILESRKELNSTQGKNALTILIFQDLTIVPMVLLTPYLGGKEVALSELAWIGGKALLFVAGAFTIVRFCLPWLLDHVANTRKREAFILTTMLICLGTAWATAHVGLSMALGAFVAGLVLSESKYNHQALGEIVPFREIFNCLVFVSIGMLFDIRTVIQVPFLVLSCVAVLVFGKAIIAAGVTRLLGHSIKVSILTGLALSQTSEFAFVLGKIGLANGVIDPGTNQLFLAVAIISMMVSPVVVGSGPGLLRLLERLLPKKVAERMSAGVDDHKSDEKPTDHVIIVGFSLKGQQMARVLDSSRIPYV
ncbi:MAG: cation:proton antiporter, partial [Candidatus Obscuribacterales bacterium]|nr:cation:proton antiporter [Candidatus Obscuribacterales bacterium]